MIEVKQSFTILRKLNIVNIFHSFSKLTPEYVICFQVSTGRITHTIPSHRCQTSITLSRTVISLYIQMYPLTSFNEEVDDVMRRVDCRDLTVLLTGDGEQQPPVH